MPSPSARSGRSAVVTGAGNGLGREIALGLAAKGYIVFGTAMSPAEAEDLRSASAGRVSLAACDVRRAESVMAWAGGVSDAVGAGGLDILINNVSLLPPGPLEVLSIDTIRRGFEVNVFGGLLVINAFLPALREARGRIVQISSWSASVPLPFDGPSGASMATMEAFSAVYRAELKPFGVEVLVASTDNSGPVGPAQMALAKLADTMSAGHRKLYARRLAAFADQRGAVPDRDVRTAATAAQIVELAEQHPAPSRTAIGGDAERMLRFARERSDAEVDALRLDLAGLN